MISLKWFWGKFIQVSKSFIAMKGNVMINYFLYVVILVLVPGFLRHSKAFSHVEIIPGKELHCPREQWDHISLEPGLAVVSESLPGAKCNTAQGKTVLHLLPCTPSERTEGGNIYQENSTGKYFGNKHGNLVTLFKIQIIFIWQLPLPAHTHTHTHSNAQCRITKGQKFQIAWIALWIKFID